MTVANAVSSSILIYPPLDTPSLDWRIFSLITIWFVKNVNLKKDF